jgi:site-specific DNA recombinase
VRSTEIAHPSIVDAEMFAAAQERLKTCGRGSTVRKPPPVRHAYMLRGQLICGLCDRRMQGTHTHGVPYYRCRFPQEYGLANRVQHPRNVYLREDLVVPTLDDWLGGYFAPHRRASTIEAIVASQNEPTEDPACAAARATIIECDRKLERYRTALEALGDSTDPAAIGRWILEAQTERATGVPAPPVQKAEHREL